MFRKGTACALAVLMTLSTAAVSSAAEVSTASEEVNRYEAEISPLYVEINSIMSALSFSGNCAQASVMVKVPSSKASKIVYTLVLERKSGSSYSAVKTWSNQTVSVHPAGTTSIYKEYNVSSKGTYRTRISGTVYKGTSVVEKFSNIVSASAVY